MPENENKDKHNVKEIKIHVNGDHVVLHQDEAEGLEIKKAAIDQGVKDVALDFSLVKVEHNVEEEIADHQKIKVHNGDKFLMLKPDHSS